MTQEFIQISWPDDEAVMFTSAAGVTRALIKVLLLVGEQFNKNIVSISKL